MRDLIPRPQHHRPRLPAVAVPAAVVGSIALSLGASPAAAAAEPAPLERGLRDLAGTAFGQAARVSPIVAGSETHTVVLGDTVSRIAAAHGLRTADVLAWNGLDRTSVIRPGDVLRLTGAAAAPAAAPAPVAATHTVATHTVAPGDTAWAIAASHGVTVDGLLSANGLDRNAVIYPGQTLAIPGATPAAAAAAPVATAELTPIAEATHTVAAGDTVTAIAARHGLGLDAVLAANGLDRASIIYPGQALIIPGAAAVPAVAAVPAASVAGLDAEQVQNARIIIQVGRDRGVPDRGIAIALATAMVESWIRNLDWGDRDSLGLFQQRPSTGWGTPAQVTDPAHAAALFYGGPGDPNGSATRGLLDIPGWESMRFTDAAQAVQISAFPERYGEWEQQAYAWLAALG